MHRILLVQSRTNPASVEMERATYARLLEGMAELATISSLEDSKEWESPDALLKNFDGVIIGGSPEFDLDAGRPDDDECKKAARDIVVRTTPSISFILENKIPFLGICFGHQLVAEVFGGNVTHDHSQKKVGSFEVHLTEEGKRDSLFEELPESFTAQYAHHDSVTELPVGATLLASAEGCRFSALRYGDNLYTMQFHPELTAQEAIGRLYAASRYVPEGVVPESLVRASPDASKIVPKWFELSIRRDH